MSTTLIFVRHGESNANGKGLFAGHLDVGLSQRGLQQAELSANYISKNYNVDAIYSSDLQRAYMTALPIAKACQKEMIKTPQLREVFAGDWEGLSFDELQTRYCASYKVWLNDIGNAHPTSGESVEAMAARIWAAVQEIANKERNKTVVIVTHATPIRSLLCRVRNLGLDQMKNVAWVSNASLSVMEVDDGWNLVREGYDAHLASLRTYFPANV